jgi:ABC-type bacteriocin/lantibiotic exporter with double-glycine peptidase domain
MRTPVLITALAAALLVFALVYRQSQMQRQIESAAKSNQEFVEALTAMSNRLAEAEQKFEGLREQTFANSAIGSIRGDGTAQANSPARIAALETQVRNLTKGFAQRKPS